MVRCMYGINKVYLSVYKRGSHPRGPLARRDVVGWLSHILPHKAWFPATLSLLGNSWCVLVSGMMCFG